LPTTADTTHETIQHALSLRLHTLPTEGVDVKYEDHVGDGVQQLLIKLQANVSVDWAHRDSARAKMRVLVKRILRKYGYPPDLQDAAVQTVLQQAEVWTGQWSTRPADADLPPESALP